MNAVVHGHAVDGPAAVPGGDAGHDVGPGGEHPLGVERALATGDALHHDAGCVVDEDAHEAPAAVAV